jgi:hypothetical protein
MEIGTPTGPPELNPDAARALLRLLRRLAEGTSAEAPPGPSRTDGAREDGLGGEMRRAS